jgi:hypothetical protein
MLGPLVEPSDGMTAISLRRLASLKTPWSSTRIFCAVRGESSESSSSRR